MVSLLFDPLQSVVANESVEKVSEEKRWACFEDLRCSASRPGPVKLMSVSEAPFCAEATDLRAAEPVLVVDSVAPVCFRYPKPCYKSDGRAAPSAARCVLTITESGVAPSW